ncbi:polycystin-2 [Drosophila persimilis]|uniref:polycystin-2 n=1 Tax=Drosophila persimilis TaxID=7234 RepID=UPI000F08DED0|nr:polycystin-2 [Drosophila persimilis]
MAKPDEAQAKRHNRMDYLNLRLRSLRSQLMITERHRNEKLNLKYRTIVHELWVYGKVFLIHLFLNVALDRDDLYYNYKSIQTLITYNTTSTIGLSHVLFIHQLYPFIEHTLVNAFLSDDHHSLNANWVNSNSTKLLGVVRMRLLRNTGEQYGLNDPEFTEKEYSHGWSPSYFDEPYTDKSWSIYLPWLPMEDKHTFWEKIFLNIKQYGFFAAYPELKGYVVTLRDKKIDSIKVLTYLFQNNWLDGRTAAIFFDFTLYNVDADLFSVCSIRCENLPFGIIRSSMDINTVSMTMSAETVPWTIFIWFIAYVAVLLQLGVAVIVPLWFEPKRFKSFWVKVDVLILLLSMSVLIMKGVKSGITTKLLALLEVASTHDFIDFRVPARLNDWATIAMGCLICLVTLRLWKVMQFASIFQIFTMTLSLAWSALFSTACVICILMMAFGIVMVCINGNNRKNFRSLLHALATIMCFTFGFSSHVDPEDLFSGGELIGIVIYTIMAFTISILLVNVFVSILSNYFTAAKAVRDRQRKDEISFWEFLRVEYADAIRIVREIFLLQPSYKRRNRTVSENIKRKLDLQERANSSARLKRGYDYVATPRWKSVIESEEHEHKQQALHRDRISRTYTIAAILQTQLEIAERSIFGDKDGNLRSESDEDEGQIYDSLLSELTILKEKWTIHRRRPYVLSEFTAKWDGSVYASIDLPYKRIRQEVDRHHLAQPILQQWKLDVESAALK